MKPNETPAPEAQSVEEAVGRLEAILAEPFVQPEGLVVPAALQSVEVWSRDLRTVLSALAAEKAAREKAEEQLDRLKGGRALRNAVHRRFGLPRGVAADEALVSAIARAEKAEERLRELEAYNDTMLEQMSEGAVAVLSERLMDANDRAEKAEERVRALEAQIDDGYGVNVGLANHRAEKAEAALAPLQAQLDEARNLLVSIALAFGWRINRTDPLIPLLDQTAKWLKANPATPTDLLNSRLAEVWDRAIEAAVASLDPSLEWGAAIAKGIRALPNPHKTGETR